MRAVTDLDAAIADFEIRVVVFAFSQSGDRVDEEQGGGVAGKGEVLLQDACFGNSPARQAAEQGRGCLLYTSRCV